MSLRGTSPGFSGKAADWFQGGGCGRVGGCTPNTRSRLFPPGCLRSAISRRARPSRCRTWTLRARETVSASKPSTRAARFAAPLVVTNSLSTAPTASVLWRLAGICPWSSWFRKRWGERETAPTWRPGCSHGCLPNRAWRSGKGSWIGLIWPWVAAWKHRACGACWLVCVPSRSPTCQSRTRCRKPPTGSVWRKRWPLGDRSTLSHRCRIPVLPGLMSPPVT